MRAAVDQDFVRRTIAEVYGLVRAIERDERKCPLGLHMPVTAVHVCLDGPWLKLELPTHEPELDPRCTAALPALHEMESVLAQLEAAARRAQARHVEFGAESSLQH